MTDKINGLSGGTVSASAEASRKQRVASTSEGETREADKARSDQVALTDSARQRLRLEQAVNAATGVDTAKVDALRDAIEKGDYEPNPDAIAEKLMRSDLDLLR